MWSHYADNHKGVVLGFDTAIDPDIRENACQVDYSAKMPPLVTADQVAGHIIGECDLGSDEYAKTLARKTVLTKSKCWSYEKEWRLVRSIKAKNASSVAETEDVPFVSNALAYVIFGCAFNKCYGACFENILKEKYPKAECFWAKKAKHKFALEFTACPN